MGQPSWSLCAGARSMVVEQAAEATTGKLQRASGDRRQQADVSRRVQTTSLHRPGVGYYEWLKKPDGRQPYYISAADGSVLSFAGLRDRWKNPRRASP